MPEFIEEEGPAEKMIEDVSSLECERHIEDDDIQMDCTVWTNGMHPPSDEPIVIEDVSSEQTISGDDEVNNGAITTRTFMEDGVNCRVRKIGESEYVSSYHKMTCGVDL